ncbi:Calbindin Calbindin D28 D-28K [Triplophysa tibetana]|uniref:Calbindin n=1 Tax=Triplophysa tibetana TaxID=1572043 RepID=A0A5A9N305_9TELE|nr:Calbindin Calbindin D28 D-28K [Triplophysa tibetana]
MANAYLQGVEISASQFLDIFHHYDNDGNGYIEGKELQNFIKELQQARKQAGLLVQILPTEENFLLFFRQQLKSCAEFMKAWRNYDADHSGYIEADELKNFLKDLLQRAKKPYDEKKLEEYTQTTGVKMARKEFNKIFEFYDQDRNGYMDENELDALLKDLCEKNSKMLEVKKIPTYKTAIMALSDGGKLYRSELALVLCTEEM